MLDELDALRESPDLQRLLDHYVAACAADREAWQDRLMEPEGAEARELFRLHGLLIAFGWLEQNTGNVPVVRSGAVPCCYRVTAAGVRVAKTVRGRVQDEAEVLATAEEEPGLKRRKPRAKKAYANACRSGATGRPDRRSRTSIWNAG
jgi:hypothetical protein